MTKIKAQRPAMGPQLLDIEESEAVRRGDALGGEEREIREMLVIDRVELVLGDEPHEMRDLDGGDAARLHQNADAGDEGVEVRHLREDVVADDEIGAAALGRELAGEPRVEEIDQGLDAAFARGAGDIG